MSAPSATHDVARLVATLLSHQSGAAPLVPGARAARGDASRRAASASAGAPRPRHAVPTGPTGLGTSGLRIPATRPAAGTTAGTATGASGTSGASGTPVPELYCPPPLRDDRALGDEVNDRLIAWAEEIGIYPERLDGIRSTNLGRMTMLVHPQTDDPDRLLAAARCALAEWATDDYYCDDETMGSSPAHLGAHLGTALAAVDSAHLPEPHASELDEALRADPVRAALRSGFEHLARYADPSQLARVRQEIGGLFVGYGQEGSWRSTGKMPAVWEYLTHRRFNSFLPCIALVDVMDGHPLSAAEYAEPRVRRAVTMAGTASTLVNDLYSMAKEKDATGLNFNLPAAIVAEEKCTLREAVERSAAIHDELVRSFEREAAALSLTGSPALRRFLAGVWAWLGGNKAWHAGTARYGTP
ncbi:family 2 encapsulin nanocompartment cargo protein terpene cyclase [Streptomyces sp. DSM 40473]|uniref:Terpene synthase n=2 Tax=Streptomyces hesseae TaxID=3075519 RepID=A0ABU2SLG5_9ACTN|nr:family 2 encapsulin nanocompartment cargo protein terpene cyclase [Streptomyces sp. DSM 40473]